MVDRTRVALAGLPLYFIKNLGQVDARAAYYVHGRHTTIYLGAEGVTLVATSPPDPARTAPAVSGAFVRPVATGPHAAPPSTRQRWAVKLEFVGANPSARPDGEDPTPALVSYFKGPTTAWRTGLPTYARVVYRELWPGIDLEYTGTGSRLKYTFLVKPGADPRRIRLAYRGATAVRVTDAGQLEVAGRGGSLTDDRPYAYQDVGGRRVEVRAAYALEVARHEYGFAVGPYDATRPLVLDPAVFVYAGYIGGAGDNDSPLAIAVDGVANAYIAGVTDSPEASFPDQVGPDVAYNDGMSDAFVVKVNAAGTGLVYAGYIGGSETDLGRGIAVDGDGNAYVVGVTHSSPDDGFPVTDGAVATTYGGGGDAFVAKVNPAGTGLAYCTYIGGTNSDAGVGIAVDGAASAFVTGSTWSSSSDGFPATPGGPDTSHNGFVDAFVVKLSPTGSTFDYAGFIGGELLDFGFGIAVDGLGNAYVTGSTISDESSFPVTLLWPRQDYRGGLLFGDAFLAKVDPGGALVYAGYIGGEGEDAGTGVAVDASGYAYVVGWTSSTEATFPTATGPAITYNGGERDAFVVKVNPAGTIFVYAGYIGGVGDDAGWGIALRDGNAYVVGSTTSDEASFPVAAGPSVSHSGGDDTFVAKLNVAGTAFVYAGYVGGGANDFGAAIAVDADGDAYITGATQSDEATFPVLVGPFLTYNGGFQDGYVAKVRTPVYCAQEEQGVVIRANKDTGVWSAEVLGVKAAAAKAVLSGQGKVRLPKGLRGLVLIDPGNLTLVVKEDTAGTCEYSVKVTGGPAMAGRGTSR